METQATDNEPDDWDDRIGDLWSLNERERTIMGRILFVVIFLIAIAVVAIVYYGSK